MPIEILEHFPSGSPGARILVSPEHIVTQRFSSSSSASSSTTALLGRVFLPLGYPSTVTPDYTRYQILNALQAFCSSFAGLLASRSRLEGFGVGNAGASATQAMILSVIQDVSSRLTTIYAGYHVGSLLLPEAKTYRFIADIVNDVSLVLETLSPYFVDVEANTSVFGLVSLCLCGCFRAMCGVAAGGSKAAITMHFASVPGGDIGDLNAKDGSKETVLSLVGMLLGTLLLPHITTRLATFVVFMVLIALHLFLNCLAVHGLVFRTFNRQRLSIAWMLYTEPALAGSPSLRTARPNPVVVATKEHIFASPNSVRRGSDGEILGTCQFNRALSAAQLSSIYLEHLCTVFHEEQFLLWAHPSRPQQMCISLKEGYSSRDLLLAWCCGCEVLRLGKSGSGVDRIFEVCKIVRARFDPFLLLLEREGWTLESPGLLAGPLVIVSIQDDIKKDQ